MEFGSVLRKMRRLSGYSQEALAEKLHISRSNISRLETNNLKLTAEDLINWCKITNHPEVMMAFIYGTDVMAALSGTTQIISFSTNFIGGILC